MENSLGCLGGIIIILILAIFANIDEIKDFIVSIIKAVKE